MLIDTLNLVYLTNQNNNIMENQTTTKQKTAVGFLTEIMNEKGYIDLGMILQALELERIIIEKAYEVGFSDAYKSNGCNSEEYYEINYNSRYEFND